MPSPASGIRGRVDADGRLVAADPPLAALQQACGGDVPGAVAIPALIEVTRAASRHRRRLRRPIRAQDAASAITAVADIVPEGEGWALALSEWRSVLLAEEEEASTDADAALAALLADLHASLAADHSVLAVGHASAALEPVAAAMRVGIGAVWTDFVEIAEAAHRPSGAQLDGAEVRVGNGAGRWQARLFARSGRKGSPGGADLYLVPWDLAVPPESGPPGTGEPQPGGALDSLTCAGFARALRPPIDRIIADAEAIRGLAPSPADDYAAYAGDIAEAARYLRGLLADLADLGVIDAPEFVAAAAPVDLADSARRAAAMLAVESQRRRIRVECPAAGPTAPSLGDPGRVLQVLLNLLGNALRYAPEGSTVRLITTVEGDRAAVTVVDEGPGLSSEQQARAFGKFERLGRCGGGGSGLGLYISLRLARAMGGDLTVASTPGEGARFTLALPAGAKRLTVDAVAPATAGSRRRRP